MIGRFGVAVMLASLAGPALASGYWTDKYGRIMTMQFPGADETPLRAGGHSLDQAASAFKQLCVDHAFDKAATGSAAEALDWGFAYRTETAPFKEPVDIGGWRAPDAQLNVANGIFFSKEPQCNLTVALQGQPDKDAAIAAMTSLFGVPVNQEKARKKDGTPNKNFQPEWRVSASAGLERMAFVHQHDAGQVQFALVERKGAK